MLRRFRDYLVSLTVVLAAYWLYAQSVGRLVEPPYHPRRAQAEGSGAETVKRRHPFAHLFAEGDWELDNPKFLETTQGTLIFQDYAPRDGGRLEIRPCTLIAFSDAGEPHSEVSGRPIVLRANQGALLEFQGGVDLARARFGRLTGGRLQGEVRVFSPESEPGAGDQLELVTRNVEIEPQRVWTPHEVQFRYGGSYGSGSDFILSLAPAPQVAGKNAAVAPLGQIEGLQITQLKELVLQIPRGSFPNPSVSLETVPATSGPAPLMEQIRITCEGPFKFDAGKQIGTFEERVLVQRSVSGAEPDQLRCDQLGVFFLGTNNDPAASAAPLAVPPNATPNAATTSSGTPRGIERIVAIGTPVVMESPSQQATSTAERLEYNLQTRQVLLKMLNSSAKVTVRRGTEEFIAPELAYELGPASRIGRLWAPGPGNMVATLGSGENRRQVTASWRREIRIRPQDANVVVSLLDEARVVAAGQGDFHANELHFWLIQLPGGTWASASSSSTTTSSAELLPDRLLALGRVRIDSPQLLANLDRVEAWFTHVPVERAAPPAIVQSPSTPPVLQLQPASGPVAVAPPAPPIREPQRAAPPQEAPPQFQVLGELARLQLRVQGEETSLRQLTVEGKLVKVSETNATPGEQPLYLQGRVIDLADGLGRDSVITVRGEPALVTARDISLRSTQLVLQRRDNRLLVEQAGELTLPVKQGFHGEELTRPGAVQVAWQGSFVFDGLLARFRRGVTVRGPGYQAAADELQASLSRPLDFSGEQSPGSAELRSLALLGEVRLENRTFTPDGRQESLERLEAPRVQLDRISGELLASGPGWVSLVQPGSRSSAGPNAASRTLPFGATDQSLQYLRVEFREALRGNLQKRQVDFNDQVQAVFGPVPHWDARIDPTQRAALGDRGAIMQSDQLTVAQFASTSDDRDAWEMTALGNTRVEGRDYEAFARRLSFTTAKNQLVLEGDGRFDAKIKRGADNSYLEAQRILFQPDTNALQLDGSRVISFGPAGSAPPSSRPPPSPRDVRARQ